MKKFLSGALMALMLMGLSALKEANQTELENLCCGGSYYCAADSDSYDGEYCDRNGCCRR